MRVFHGLVNYGTQAGFVARGLRDLGVKAKSYTFMDTYNRPTDYMFSQRHGLISKLWFYGIYYPLVRFICFFKFDVFHFYFGTSLSKNQWDLPFYRLFGKKVIMHYLGNDVELYQWSKENYDITVVTDMWSEQDGLAHDKKILKRLANETPYCDEQIVCSPQYSPFVKDAKFIPLGLDLEQFSFSKIPPIENAIRIVHAPTSRKKKGTQYLIDAVEKLQSEGVAVELDVVEGVSHAELLERYKEAHICVVSLMGGWYGTSAIEAMALGRPVVSFVRESLFDYIDWTADEVPIISANKNTIYEVLKDVLSHPERLEEIAKESRTFAINRHDYHNVAKNLLNMYQNL